MKVLLISPLDPKAPTNLKYLMGGENTYTRTLLKNPPEGISYTHFTDALEKGYIKYTFWQKPLNFLIKLRILPLSPQILCFKIKTHFDLVHAHVHPVKLSGIKPPVLLSDSSSNILFLKGYLGWNNTWVVISYGLKRAVVKMFGIYDQELNLKDAQLVVWSHFAKRMHKDLGCPVGRIMVIPPGIGQIKQKKIPHKTFCILFVGTWFKRKGGELLLEAYLALRKIYPNLHLTLIGEIPKKSLPLGIQHLNYIPREKLIADIFPQTDVLVLVPPKAEGYGISVLEAAAFGVPSIVSSVGALSEIVEDKKTGFTIKPGSVEELKQTLEKLIRNPELAKKMGEAARKRFDEYFGIHKSNKLLFDAYVKTTSNRDEGD